MNSDAGNELRGTSCVLRACRGVAGGEAWFRGMGERCFEYRTAEVRKNTSKFDIPCSIFCGSTINNRLS